MRIVTIVDDPDTIAAEVKRCSETTDVVFTTGGVGPTHDDLTFEGVARAFGEPLELRAELVDLLNSYSLPINEATLRMARVPKSTVLIESPGLAYPVARVHNVYVFPGVPKLFQSKFEAMSERFRGEPVHAARLYSPQSETRIAEVLMEVAGRHPHVDIGSYPRFGEGTFKVIITLESLVLAQVEAAREELERLIETVVP